MIILCFNPFGIKVNKCNGNYNNINDPYAKTVVPDIAKNLNVKVFNLMSRNNETRQKKWHKKCKCKWRLDKIISNNKQKWNKDKSRCDCKILINKRVCDKGLIWNPSNCECECDKSYNVGEYLSYSDCKCRKKFTDKLIDECIETIEETELINITFIENENNYECDSCIVYIVLIHCFDKCSFYNFYWN